ncbi:MAG TPA: hypothetical protein PLS90_09590 [Candidatus Sumerlaeota bacterium]|nr:hypothetical protein [Candidatus Sumerlaeota bacterium]HOR29003.1 hypothetical protein [Candidatus Sumerlaeota bacterium]HPK02695.1 hypothetical protein [Candidatus Sumerlaeota bacterium]
MNPTTLEQTKRAMIEQEPHWYVAFMDFVDEFRRTRDVARFAEPWPLDHPRYDALLASTLEYLCDEAGIEPPAWSWEIPACPDPWFVAGVENLKALALVQSPAHFRRRKIFVLENFLARV